MKIKRSEMIYGLDSIANSIDKRDVVPALQCVLIDKGSMTSYNRVTGARVEGLEIEDFTILVPFLKLYNFIKSVREKELDFDIDGSNVKLKAGRASIALATLPVEDFPDFKKVFKLIKKEGKEVPKDFFFGIQQCLPFVSRDRQELAGVYVEGSMILASDSKRIARKVLSSEPFKGQKIMLSSETVRATAKMMDIQAAYIDKDKAIFQNEDLIVFGSLLTVEFPKVVQYFPESINLVYFPREALISGLKRLVDFSDEANDKKFVRVEFGKSLKISYEGETSEMKEFFDFGQTLYDKPFEVNPYHFLAMLENCNKYSFHSKSIPMLYGQSEDQSFKVLIAIKG